MLMSILARIVNIGWQQQLFKEEIDMLRIVFKDGSVRKYKNKRFTDYYYDRKVFVVMNKKQWVGIYNIDAIATVEYLED